MTEPLTPTSAWRRAFLFDFSRLYMAGFKPRAFLIRLEEIHKGTIKLGQLYDFRAPFRGVIVVNLAGGVYTASIDCEKESNALSIMAELAQIGDLESVKSVGMREFDGSKGKRWTVTFTFKPFNG